MSQKNTLTKLQENRIKELLSNYRRIRAKIRTGIIKENPKKTSGGSSGVAKIGDGGTDRGSRLEDDSIEYLDEGHELYKLNKAREIIKIAYEELTEREQAIVQEKFFEERTYPEVGRRIEPPVTKRTVQRNVKNTILPKLRENGILKAWKFYDRNSMNGQS